MSRHSLDITPASMFLDGQEWVLASYANELKEALREKKRSKQSHNHQFAAIYEMWENLPHTHAQAPYAASKEAFRKHGLIVTGHCDVDTIDCESHAAALRTAPTVAKHARAAHGYALVVVRGPLVVCSTPHSQSYKAMGKDLFHQSKRDVLEWAAGVIGAQI